VYTMNLTTDTNKPPIILTREDARALELKLNVTSKKHLWSSIGDMLYAYHTRKSGAKTSIVLTDEQYEFLSKLMLVSADTCNLY